jgi:aspartyl-tRNA(Asn)/glutamyl-tRNA(Gln) amidotransferase subunit A
MKNGPLDCFEVAATVQTHERTALAVADEALSTAERLQKDWNAFITITPELAHRQAERVDRFVGQGRRLPLAGVPFAVKDLIDVKDVPTTCGSCAFREQVADGDATVIRRLVDSGAVLVGKLNMHECAFGFTGENPTFGDCKNPWDKQRIAGGSSSGSAVAVQLGICPFTLGSDTGGSIRQPAALCGLVGLKPTYGRVSRAGVVPLSWSMDHVGPLTRTAKEAALVLEVLGGSDTADDTTSDRAVPKYTAVLDRPLEGVRIGIPEPWFFDAIEPAVAAAVESAIQVLVEAGCQRAKLELPHMDEVLGAHRAIIFSEASAYHRPFLETAANRYSDDIRPLLLGGLFLSAADYLQAQRVRTIVCRAWADVLRTVDCLVTPTLPIVATKFGQESASLPGGEKALVRAYLDLLLPFNLTGHPAVSVPCGFSQETLPIGLQIVGKPFDEATILRVAHQYQQRTNWHQRMPATA